MGLGTWGLGTRNQEDRRSDDEGDGRIIQPTLWRERARCGSVSVGRWFVGRGSVVRGGSVLIFSSE